jgi:hypothetical protein
MAPHNPDLGHGQVASVEGIHQVGATNPPPTLQGGSMSEVLSTDHVELLATAAVRWQVTLPESSPVPAPFRLSADQTAALLLALHGMVTDSAVPASYAFAAVDWPQPPVQVLKAVHAYEHLCRNLAAWDGSVAQQLLAAVERAAMERLPGYSEAAWVWHREGSQTHPVVGVALDWRPAVAGLTWLEPDIDPAVWSAARAVVVTSQAWSSLPLTLKGREDIYVLLNEGEGIPAEPLLAAVAAAYWLVWPLNEAFLAELVAGGES